MKSFHIIFSVVLLCVCNLNAQEEATEPAISLEELNRRNVVGYLGMILGTSTEIDAEIVSGRSLDVKGYDQLYLLKVTHVAGKKLDVPPMMKFSVLGIKPIQLASQTRALYELKHGVQVDRLSSLQIEELEKGYVGKKVRLSVYETGGFTGIPKQLPEDVPEWADTGFQFSTSLVVLNELKASLPKDKPAR